MSITTEPHSQGAKRSGYGLLLAFAVTLVAVAGGTFTLLPIVLGPSKQVRDTLGGPFRLLSSKGGVLDSASLTGEPYLVFFGFTQCPNVCPTTLADLSNLLDRLATEGMPMQAVYITLDPEQDTQAVMQEYMASFSDRITGVTGTQEEIEQVRRAYRAFAQRVSLPDGSQTIAHTVMVYLMDRRGRFAEPLYLVGGHDIAIKQIRRVAAEGGRRR